MNKFTEKTLVILKFDAVQRSLIGEIIGRFEKVGLKLVACKLVIPTVELVRKHYLCDEDFCKRVGGRALEKFAEKNIPLPKEGITAQEYGETILNLLVKYYTSGPVLPMVWEGPHAVGLIRKLVGGVEPLSSDVGTIRGDYVLDSFEMSDIEKRSIFNLIHASGEIDEANREIPVWFKDTDVIKYKSLTEKVTYGGGADICW